MVLFWLHLASTIPPNAAPEAGLRARVASSYIHVRSPELNRVFTDIAGYKGLGLSASTPPFLVLASRFWSEWFAISFIWAGLCSHRYDEVNQPVLPHKCALNTISTVFHAQAKGHPMHRDFKADYETSAQNDAS